MSKAFFKPEIFVQKEETETLCAKRSKQWPAVTVWRAGMLGFSRASPISLVDHFTIWLSDILFFTCKYPNQDTKKKTIQ